MKMPVILVSISYQNHICIQEISEMDYSIEKQKWLDMYFYS